MARKPIIFISYAHRDEPDDDGTFWCTYVVGFLRAAFPNEGAEIWLDKLIKGGADWSPEIERKLARCDAFLLLVSHHSLTSEYIVKREIEAIRKRQEKGERVLLYPLLLTPTPRNALKLIDSKQMRPGDQRPLSSFPPHERKQKVVDAADEIAEILERQAGGSEKAAESRIVNRDTFRAWLDTQKRETAVAIAARAALRVLPLYRSSRAKRGSAREARRFAELTNTTALFRATVLARATGKYPARANELRAAVYAAYAAALADAAADAAALATADAAALAAALAAYAAAADAADAAATAATAAATAASDAAAVWESIERDAERVASGGSLADAPLWPSGPPDWARDAWAEMQRLLPKDQDWQVWISWYEDRLRGVPRGEAYEFAFVDWPDDVWKQGPKVVNARIRERLAKLGAEATARLPEAVGGVEIPIPYAWNARGKIEPEPGAQNLPTWRLPTGEEDKRAAVKLCRVGARRLLETLRGNRKFDAPPSYEIHLQDYLEDLPGEAGQGDILLAHQRMMNLAAMLEADRKKLDKHFVIQLEAVIRAHRALDPFFEIVRRHDEAVRNSRWSMAFPLDEAKKLVRDVQGTEEIFEPAAGDTLARVEASAPPAETRPAAKSQAAAEPGSAQASEPDPTKSQQRHFATVANSLWSTFLEGPRIIGTSQAWLEAGHKLADSVGPVLEWLRSLGV